MMMTGRVLAAFLIAVTAALAQDVYVAGFAARRLYHLSGQDLVSSIPLSGYVNGAAQITAISGTLLNGVTDQTLNVTRASLTKAFSPTTIDQGGTSTLTFTLTNGAGNPGQSGINFIDTFPANVTVAATPNITTTCSSGTGVVTATAGAGSIAVAGATMNNTQASCTITVDVTSNTPGGPYNNTSASISGTANITNSVAYVLFANDPGGLWLSRQGDLGYRLQVVRELDAMFGQPLAERIASRIMGVPDVVDAGQEGHPMQKAQQAPRRLVRNGRVHDRRRKGIDREEADELRIDRAEAHAFYRPRHADQG